jgi:hypothetical protein
MTPTASWSGYSKNVLLTLHELVGFHGHRLWFHSSSGFGTRCCFRFDAALTQPTVSLLFSYQPGAHAYWGTMFIGGCLPQFFWQKLRSLFGFDPFRVR